MPPIKKDNQEIINLLSKINEPKLMSEFLEDLLTPEEFESITKRLLLVKLLNKGISQREISEKLGVAIATVTRGSRELKKKNSGFKKILDKFYK